MQVENVIYDADQKQIKLSLGGLQLNIPTYMLISDIEYYIQEHQIKAAIEFMKKAQYEAAHSQASQSN